MGGGGKSRRALGAMIRTGRHKRQLEVFEQEWCDVGGRWSTEGQLVATDAVHAGQMTILQAKQAVSGSIH